MRVCVFVYLCVSQFLWVCVCVCVFVLMNLNLDWYMHHDLPVVLYDNPQTTTFETVNVTYYNSHHCPSSPSVYIDYLYWGKERVVC